MSSPSSSIPLWLRAPRNSLWIVAAIVLLVVIAIVSPAQLMVVLYKVALIALGVVLTYLADRALFPYARPDGYLHRDWRRGTAEPTGEADYPVVLGCEWLFSVATLRRALIACAVINGMASGL